MTQRIPKNTALTPDEQLTVDYYNTKAEAWNAGRAQNPLFWAEQVNMLKQHLPNGKVLEIGAGVGKEGRLLTDAGYHYTGTDISDGLLAEARKNYPDLNFSQASVYELPFANNSFDGFWAAAVLLHIPKERLTKALKELHRILKVGGIGFISLREGNGQGVENIIAYGTESTRFFAYYREEELHAILRAHGFEIVESSILSKESLSLSQLRPTGWTSRWLCVWVKRGKIQ